MTATAILQENVADFASRLRSMTGDEVFAAMSALERHSEDDTDDRDGALSRIALVEEEIEQRFPGQMLAPYRAWKNEQPLLP